MAAAVWELDLRTAELTWSDGMHRLAGSDPSTTRPSLQWWTSLVVPAERARVRAWLLVVRESRRGGEEQFDLVGLDGVVRRVHAWTEVEVDAAGEPLRMFGSAVDVTGASPLGHRDPLTDLVTRAAVLSHLEAEAREAGRQRVAGGTVLALVDVDRFSVLDDALGRETGDALLRAVAARLRTAAPEGATVARLDGDVFAVVVGRSAQQLASAPDAAGLAERLLAALRRPTALSGLQEPVATTASIGLVTTDGGEADADDVVRRAGLALRRAKRQGRDRAVHYSAGLGEAAMQRVRTEAMLRSALDAEHLAVLYQPVVDLGTGEVVGVEALARVVDPELGPALPGRLRGRRRGDRARGAPGRVGAGPRELDGPALVPPGVRSARREPVDPPARHRAVGRAGATDPADRGREHVLAHALPPRSAGPGAAGAAAVRQRPLPPARGDHRALPARPGRQRAGDPGRR